MTLFPAQEHKKVTRDAIDAINAAYPIPIFAQVTANHTPSLQRHTAPAHRKPVTQTLNVSQPPTTHMVTLHNIEEPRSDNKMAPPKTHQILASQQVQVPFGFNAYDGNSSPSIRQEEWTTVQRKKKKQQPFLGKYNHSILLKKMQVLREQGKCFKCVEKGHLQAACRNTMKCFKCQGFGHKSAWCKHKSEKVISSNTVPLKANNTTILKEKNREQNQNKNTKAEMENWQTIPMLSPAGLPPVRHEMRRAYVPSREGFHPSNEVLERAAVIHMGPNCNEHNLPHCFATTLAATLHRHPHDFKIGKLDQTTGHFMVIFPTVDMRNHALHVGVFAIDYNSHVQLAEWKPSLGMTYDTIAYRARLKLTAVPMDNWNFEDLDQLLAGIGHVLKLAPVFINENFETVRVLIACHNPANIPPTLLLTTNPLSTTVFINLEGWLHSPVGHIPPPGGDEPCLQRNNGRHESPTLDRYSPESRDYSRTITDVYRQGADSTYSRRTRPVQVTTVQPKPVCILNSKNKIEKDVRIQTGENRGNDKKKEESLESDAGKLTCGIQR